MRMFAMKGRSGDRLLFVGAIFVLLGIGAIVSPTVAGGAVVYIIGSFLVLTGILQSFARLKEGAFERKILQLSQGSIMGAPSQRGTQRRF